MAYLPPAAAPDDQHLIQSHGRPSQQQAAAMHAAALVQQQAPHSATAAMASMRHFSLANMESFLPMQPMLDSNAMVAPEAASALANMACSATDPLASTLAQVCSCTMLYPFTVCRTDISMPMFFEHFWRFYCKTNWLHSLQVEYRGVATADSTPSNTGLVPGATSDGTTNTTNFDSTASVGQTQQQPAAGVAVPSECTSISESTSATNATTTPAENTPATSGGTRTASPRTADSGDANTLCGLANFNNMRVTVDHAESAREESGAELRSGEEPRGVSDSKSMSSGGVAENTASAANVTWKGPSAPLAGDDGECAHDTDGAQTAGAREKGAGDSKEIKAEEGTEVKDSKESKSNPFMHVEESRGSALSSDNLLVC